MVGYPTAPSFYERKGRIQSVHLKTLEVAWKGQFRVGVLLEWPFGFKLQVGGNLMGTVPLLT